MSKNILVTGASGFIGSWLIEELLQNKKYKKYKIYAVDIKKKKFSKKIIFKNIDISKRDFISYVKKIKPVKCYHLAAQTSSIISEKKPQLDIKYNIIGTQNLVDALKFLPSCEINFTSSMSVYGDAYNNFSGPYPQPKSMYGISKLSGEYILKRLSQYSHKVRIFRLFNVYGTGQDLDNLEQGMLSIFVAQALKDNNIIVKGSPSRTRDFIDVRDVIRTFLISFDNLKPGIYDVGTGKSISVRDLVKLISSSMQVLNIKLPKINYEKGFKEDIKHSKAKKIRKIQIKYELKKEILSFIKWSQTKI